MSLYVDLCASDEGESLLGLKEPKAPKALTLT